MVNQGAEIGIKLLFYGQTDLTLTHGWSFALFAGNLNTWRRVDQTLEPTRHFIIPQLSTGFARNKFIFPSVSAYFIIVRIIKEVCEAEAGAALVSDSDGY